MITIENIECWYQAVNYSVTVPTREPTNRAMKHKPVRSNAVLAVTPGQVVVTQAYLIHVHSKHRFSGEQIQELAADDNSCHSQTIIRNFTNQIVTKKNPKILNRSFKIAHWKEWQHIIIISKVSLLPHRYPPSVPHCLAVHLPPKKVMKKPAIKPRSGVESG